MIDEQQTRLVERIRSGDSAAETELFKNCMDRIYWKVSRQIKSDIAEIEDVVAEVYMAILEGLRKETFQPGKWESLEAFIHGVTNNKIRDWFKKNKKRTEVFSSDRLLEEISEFTEEFRLEFEELRKRMRSAIKSLPPPSKEIIDLFYYQELSRERMLPMLSCRRGSL